MTIFYPFLFTISLMIIEWKNKYTPLLSLFIPYLNKILVKNNTVYYTSESVIVGKPPPPAPKLKDDGKEVIGNYMALG